MHSHKTFLMLLMCIRQAESAEDQLVLQTRNRLNLLDLQRISQEENEVHIQRTNMNQHISFNLFVYLSGGVLFHIVIIRSRLHCC